MRLLVIFNHCGSGAVADQFALTLIHNFCKKEKTRVTGSESFSLLCVKLKKDFKKNLYWKYSNPGFEYRQTSE